MDNTGPGERYIAVDLESRGTSSEEDLALAKDVDLEMGQAPNLSDWAFDGFVNSNKGEAVSDSADVPVENVEALADKKLGGGKTDKDVRREIPRKKRCKRHPKPPRPPKLPLLDAADRKLVSEITKLAILKRARTEHMKVLKKMKSAKAASSSSISGSNVCAAIITILFFLVIILQAK